MLAAVCITWEICLSSILQKIKIFIAIECNNFKMLYLIPELELPQKSMDLDPFMLMLTMSTTLEDFILFILLTNLVSPM